MNQILEKVVRELKTRISYVKINGEDKTAIRKIRKERLTYLSELKLIGIVDLCNKIKKGNLKGSFIEAGCALGGSAILMSKAKPVDSPLLVYDVFDMIPAPSEKDTEDVHERYEVISSGNSRGIGGDKYYGYQENLYDVVVKNFQSFDEDLEKNNISLLKGLVQDTMKLSEPVALAHIDVDWYDPVYTCLEQIFPNLIVGGSIVLDDYYIWGGCKKATDVYLKENNLISKVKKESYYGSLILTRIQKD